MLFVHEPICLLVWMNSESYFLKLVPLENTVRTQYTRNHDATVAKIQFPLGWQFFSKTNVAALIARLAKQVNSVDFNYLCPVMQWAYDTRGWLLEGNDRAVDSPAQPDFSNAVQLLNNLVERRV